MINKKNEVSDKYVLLINEDFSEEISNKNDGLLEIAKIRNLTKNIDTLFVLYDKNHLIKSNYTLHTMIIDNKWCAILYDDYLDVFKKNPKILSFAFFHELGHFLNGDCDSKNETNTSVNLSNIRKEKLNNGEVLKMELDADKFAVSQVGKSCAINFLDYSILRRKKIDNSKLAILELELRKKAIKKL